MPRCPSCDEKVSVNDSECPHCGEELEPRGPRKGGPKKGKLKSKSKGSPIVVILAVACGGLLMCGGVMAALLLPAVQQAREAARRTQCKNNLKQIGLAMHNYHDTFNLFPAAYLNDEQGQPRISWRVSILPYMDEAPRYNRYVMSEAWDGPTNSMLLQPAPRAYICPSVPVTGPNTCYATITGEKSLLGAGKCHRIMDVTDGTSNTLMVVEACRMNIPWMKPQDIDANTFTRIGDPNGVSSFHIGGVHVLLADGSVRFVSNNVDPGLVQKLITRNGDEVIPDF